MGGKILSSLSYLQRRAREGAVHRCLAKLQGVSVLQGVTPALPSAGVRGADLSAAVLGIRVPLHLLPLATTGTAKAPLALPLISAYSITPDKLDSAPTRDTEKSRPGLCTERGGGRSPGASPILSRPVPPRCPLRGRSAPGSVLVRLCKPLLLGGACSWCLRSSRGGVRAARGTGCVPAGSDVEDPHRQRARGQLGASLTVQPRAGPDPAPPLSSAVSPPSPPT